MRTALAASLLAVAGVQTAGAQETAITTSDGVNKMTPGYYYVVAGYNTDYALTVNSNGGVVLDELGDKTNPKFIWYITAGTQGATEQDGTKTISELNSGDGGTIKFYFGNPTWNYGLEGNLNAQRNVTIKENPAAYKWGTSNNQIQILQPNNQKVSPHADTNFITNNDYEIWGNYNNRPNSDYYQFVPVSDEQVTALKSKTYDDLIAEIALSDAIKSAIAAFNELKAAEQNIGTAVGKYNYTLTDDEENLIGGKYDEQDTYGSLELSEINAKLAEFTALTAAIKATYVWPDVSIVTLSWNGNRFAGWNNANYSSGDKWKDLGQPNGVNGRIALLKQDDGKFVLSSQGVYQKGNRDATLDINEATHYTMSGSFEDGLTFVDDNDNYLNSNNLTTTTTAPTQNFKVNTFTTYDKAQDTDGYVTDGNGNYANALCYPVRVKKPEGDGYHTYTVKVEDGALVTTEVDEVPAGVPFIFVRPDAATGERLIIVQDNQEYVDKPVTDYLLQGYYLQDQKEDAKFYFGVHDGIFGFYTDVQLGTATNRAYITAASAEALAGAKLFQLIDGELVVTQAHTVTYQLVDADGQKLIDDVVVEDAVHGSAPAAPAAFQVGYVTLTQKSGPEVINDNATIVYTATWNALPFEFDKEYNLAFRPNDVRYASTEQNDNGNYLVQPNATDYKRTLDAYQWKLTGNPYEIIVLAKDGRSVVLNDDSNYATLEEGADFTFTLVKVDDTTFSLQANDLTVTKGQVYLADYENPGKLGRWSAGDEGIKIQAVEIPEAPKTVEVAVGTEGYVTLTSQWPLDFTNAKDVKAYVAVRNGDVIDFEQIEKVPAETGLLIKGAKGSNVKEDVAVSTEAGALTGIQNVFVGTLVNKNLAEGDLVLYNAAFYAVGASAVTLPAGKAYIPAEAAAGARIASLDEETTGINEVKEAKADGIIRDLKGVRVTKPGRGLYIIDGKKTIFK